MTRKPSRTRPKAKGAVSGAGGAIGTEAAARSANDGYTFLLTPGGPLTVLPHLRKVGYDPRKDFSSIGRIATAPNTLVVHPSFPAQSMTELVAQAKARPGQISYASAGFGTTNHLAFELFKTQTGTDFVHVPYRGNPLAMIDVIAGQVPVFFDFVLTGAPHVKSGAVRALATTGAQRSGVLPDVPTAMEAGIKDFEASTWFAFYAPAGTPKDLVEKINAEIAAVLGEKSGHARSAFSQRQLPADAAVILVVISAALAGGGLPNPSA